MQDQHLLGKIYTHTHKQTTGQINNEALIYKVEHVWIKRCWNYCKEIVSFENLRVLQKQLNKVSQWEVLLLLTYQWPAGSMRRKGSKGLEYELLLMCEKSRSHSLYTHGSVTHHFHSSCSQSGPDRNHQPAALPLGLSACARVTSNPLLGKHLFIYFKSAGAVMRGVTETNSAWAASWDWASTLELWLANEFHVKRSLGSLSRVRNVVSLPLSPLACLGGISGHLPWWSVKAVLDPRSSPDNQSLVLFCFFKWWSGACFNWTLVRSTWRVEAIRSHHEMTGPFCRATSWFKFPGLLWSVGEMEPHVVPKKHYKKMNLGLPAVRKPEPSVYRTVDPQVGTNSSIWETNFWAPPIHVDRCMFSPLHKQWRECVCTWERMQ